MQKSEKKKKIAENKVEDIKKKLGIYSEVSAKGKSSGRELKIIVVANKNWLQF
ncbi:hypothetical protein [Proteus hauseri]|uniref:hypothetical protein n=1 Tax=Proteus hauseri TaxID=183417 RepID=UPI0013E964A9|nr:hypothetical protein [Proteus hauseri]